MRPPAHFARHDAPGLIDELVPCEGAVVDDVDIGFEDAVRQPVVAHELQDIFDRVEFGVSWRQWHQGDVGRHDQFGRSMPSGLFEQEDVRLVLRCISLAIRINVLFSTLRNLVGDPGTSGIVTLRG